MQSSQICVFSKHLVGPPLGTVARKLKAMGINTIDLTVRSGGHVEPEAVIHALPHASEELAQNGVRIAMITTNITDADNKDTDPLLRTAQSLGIGFYKLGYYSYAGFGTLRKDRAEVRAKVRNLAALNREVGIQGGFHNHSQSFIGANLGDIDFVLDGIDKEAVGLYFDPAHAVIEGGAKGWELGLDLLQDRIVMLAVKDYQWVESDSHAGGRRFKVQWCPLEQGNVPWHTVLGHLNRIGFSGPISLHSEYQGKNSFHDLTTEEVFEQTDRDAQRFRAWLKQSESEIV